MAMMKTSNIIFLCVGCIIGWGAFILPGELFLKIGLINTFIGLGIGATLVGLIARNYVYVLSKFPQVGGEFIFTLNTLGKKHGFICGWFLSLAYLCIIPLNATAASLVIDYFGLDFLHIMPMYRIHETTIYFGDILISLASIFVIGAINALNIRIVFGFQKIFTLILCGSVLLFFGIMSADGVSYQNLHTYSFDFSLHSIFIVIAISPWLFLGFDCGIQIVQDIKYNKNRFWIFTIISIFIGFLLYTMMICITAFGIPKAELSLYQWATGESVYRYFGVIGSIILTFGIIGAIASGINGFFITTNKVLYAITLHHILPRFFLKLNRHNIAHRITIGIMLASAIMPFFGRKALLYVVDMASIGIVIAFLYVNIITFMLKYKENHKYDILAIIGIAISIFFFLLLFLPFSPSVLKLPSIIALVIWIFLGIVFYYSSTKTFVVHND